MSLALFHEYQESRQGVSSSVAGKFTAPDAAEVIRVEGRSFSLFRSVTNDSASESLKYVPGIIPISP